MKKSLTSLSELSVQEILAILEQAQHFAEGESWDGATNSIVANLFFEPSTRTQYSFHTAELRLGCQVIGFSPESSSLKKGETFYDTVKTFESFGVDAVVIRHTQNEYYNQLKDLRIPVINGGDGTGNHPTQSLLDLLTIQQEFGGFAGLRIAIVGDISHSRVAHTNMEVMARLGMDCYVSGPEQYREACYRTLDFDTAVREMDIVMLLRIQHERHGDGDVSMVSGDYNRLYGMNSERLTQLKPGAIIMHPAPFNRGVELTDEVVECSRSRIFKQVQNGVFVRMAALKRALE
ncbi:MAG: aspartate carbamoyltransferase catalytic subunit [Angelakisella sp.]